MDKFPEAFNRFKDDLPDEINKEEDTYSSLKAQFERWQLFGMTKRQEDAFQTQLKDYGIFKTRAEARKEPIAYERREVKAIPTREFGKVGIVNLRGHKHRVARDPKGRFSKWLKG